MRRTAVLCSARCVHALRRQRRRRRPRQSMAATTGELLVTVQGASDLQDCEQWGNQDPYCVVSFSNPVSADGAAGYGAAAVAPTGAAGAFAVSAATQTAMKGGVNPVWQETLALPVTADPGELVVQVFNQNRAAPDDLVGYGSIQVYDVLRSGCGEFAVPLAEHPSGRPQGVVRLSLEFRPLASADLAEAAARADMEEEPQLHGHDREPLPDIPGAQPTAQPAQQPPALSDLRPLSPGREKAYDRVHRSGYLVPGDA